MMVAGYEHDGFVISDEESKDYIWKKVRGNEETKTELLEYICLLYTSPSPRDQA